MLRLIIFLRPYAKYLLLLWVLTIIIVSSTPNVVVPKLHTGRTVIRLDYLIHFLEYGLLTGLSFIAFAGERFVMSKGRVFRIMLILVIFAAADEFHQKLIPGRSFNPKDLYSNISGIITGAVVSLLLFRMIANKPRMNE